MKTSRLMATSVAMFAAAGLLLSGCSASAGEDSGEKKLTFMFRGGEDEKKAYEKAIAEFEKANDIEVDVIVTTADQYITKLKAAIAGKKVPDVFYINQGDVQSYVKNGVVKDITEYVEGSDTIDLDNIWEYGVDSYRYDGKLVGDGAIYALPKDVGPFSFGYNKTMFEEAGIPLPDKDTPLTLDQFVDISKQLTKDTDGDGKTDQWGTGLNVQWNLQPFVWSNGGDWLNKDRTKVTVDTPEFAEALQWFADLQNVHAVTPSVAEAQTLDTYQRWMKGELGFFPVGPWDVSTYEKLDFDWDLIPYPVGESGKSATWVGSLGIAVSNGTEHPEEAVKLVEYLTADAEAQQSLVDAGIQIPNLKDMADSWVEDSTTKPANKEEFLQIVNDYGRGLPANNTYNSEWYDELFTNIQPVIDGKQTAAEYLKQAQPKMQAFLDAANQQAGIG
ncbi:sugar ABC transporter substrate-binding protein [Mycetocola manganoxydans]|uniref:Sugar ABC transporter substrate-binding protein n=2 Tax=Mycetocola manganoxydans TaxID=699879 RepID=A0A3L7A1P8_9MICO|nr:sugar ABC transporter substrate-binding protein [Mycetocola manganoxydans]GHD41453.1 sugar ABC transporter substrate-binding protein [Mycetocola manganoxydans]